MLVAYRPSPRFSKAQEAGTTAAAADEASATQRPAQQGYTAKVERTIIRGPVLHIPEPDEFFHEFKWQ